MRYICIPFLPVPHYDFQSLYFLYTHLFVLFVSYIHLFFLFLQPCSYVYECSYVDPYVFFENIHSDNNYIYNYYYYYYYYYYFQYSFYILHLLHSFLFHCHLMLLVYHNDTSLSIKHQYKFYIRCIFLFL